MLEVKQLVENIQKGFAEFKAANDERLKVLEKGAPTGDHEAKLAAIQGDISNLLGMKKDLEAIEAKQNRLVLAGGEKGISAEEAEYKTAFFDKFVRKGNEDGLKELQQKAHNITTGSDGGYAVPKVIDSAIEKLMRDVSPMRQLARVVTVGTSDYRKLVNKNGIASGWVGESDARSATGTSSLAEVTPPMGELYANPQVTQQALDDVFFNLESEVISMLAEEFAVAEGAAFISGNGTNKPKGFLAYTTAATADSSRAFGTLEHIATGVSADFAASNKADVLYQVQAALRQGYRANAVWMMGKAMMFELMRIKDTTGQYLWQPSLQAGVPVNLLGTAVYEAEDMPVKAANSLSIAYGDFNRGYTIVDRVGTRMLRDPYTNKPYVGFYTTKRVGGGVINSEAIKLIKFSAS